MFLFLPCNSGRFLLLKTFSRKIFRWSAGKCFIKRLHHSHKKEHSLEIWAVKLRFLLIDEKLLTSFATACSECTFKQEKKANYNTDHLVPNLIDFFGDDWKEIKTQTEKKNICNRKKKLHWPKIGLSLEISDNFLRTKR